MYVCVVLFLKTFLEFELLICIFSVKETTGRINSVFTFGGLGPGGGGGGGTRDINRWGCALAHQKRGS